MRHETLKRDLALSWLSAEFFYVEIFILSPDSPAVHFIIRLLMFSCLTAVHYCRKEWSHLLNRVGKFLRGGFVVFVQAAVRFAPGLGVLVRKLLAKIVREKYL